MLEKYVLNFDEISDSVKENLEGLIKNIEIGSSTIILDEKLKMVLIKIYKQLPNLNSISDYKSNIIKLASIISHLKEIKGLFMTDGGYLNIPAIKNNYDIIFNYNYDIYITGVDFSLSAWKKEDTWNLKINEDTIFNNVTTKEIGDKKYLQQPYFVQSKSPIIVQMNNNSGNSRQIWSDLHYLIIGAGIGSIIIKCVDMINNVLLQSNKSMIVGIEQTINAPIIEGYRVVGNSSITKKVVDGEIITFFYDGNPINITIRCVDEENNLLQESNGSVISKREQIINAPDIDWYVIVGDSSVIKVFTEGEVVTFIYKLKYRNIVIKCIDEENNLLKQINQQVLNIDTEQIVDAPHIEGYSIVGDSSVSKIFTENEIVVFTYKLKYMDITVKCVDEEGNLLKQISKTIVEGIEQTVYAPNIPGYSVVGDNILTRVFENGEIITFVYKIKYINVTVKCILISESNLINNHTIGDNNVILMQFNVQVQAEIEQTISSSNINNYVVIGYLIENNKVFNATKITKIFTEGEIVSFAYKVKYINITIKCIDKENNNLLQEFNQQVLNDSSHEQTINAPNIQGYIIIGNSSVTALINDDPNCINVIYFTYRKNTINIIIKCIDELGNILKQINQQVIPDIEQTVNAPYIENYMVISDNSVTKIFTEGEIVTFFYKLSHPYRVKIQMDWEKHNSTDVDFYCLTPENKIIFFGHKQESQIWLDVDILEHVTNSIPEILTCNRTMGTIYLGVNIYNDGKLTQDVSFKIYIPEAKNGEIIDKLVKTIYVKNLNVRMAESKFYRVCDINMSTLDITEINNGECIDFTMQN